MAHLGKSSLRLHEDLSSTTNICAKSEGWQCAPNPSPGEVETAQPQGLTSRAVSPTGKLQISGETLPQKQGKEWRTTWNPTLAATHTVHICKHIPTATHIYTPNNGDSYVDEWGLPHTIMNEERNVKGKCNVVVGEAVVFRGTLELWVAH